MTATALIIRIAIVGLVIVGIICLIVGAAIKDDRVCQVCQGKGYKKSANYEKPCPACDGTGKQR